MSKRTRVNFKDGKKVSFLVRRDTPDKIIYTDNTGKQWGKKELDELFEALRKKKEAESVLEYYTPKED